MLLKGEFIFTSQDEVLRAEIYWILKCVESNFSFSSNNGNNDLFAKMFPDSKIAASYKNSETKSKYMLEFGIAKYIFEEVKNDLKNTPFTFKFDETTTVQIKKQFDGYVQYFSNKFHKIVNQYCGSLFLGHCTASQQKDHFFEFQNKMEWNNNYLLHIGMDGPNVNLAFQNLLKTELDAKNKTILNIGTCSLHPIHNGFAKCLKKIDFEFDEFPRDIWFFFKLSPARREDYKLASLITELESATFFRHVNSRWLSLKKVLTRILDQWENLVEYFLKFLPAEKNFTREIEKTDRYKRIRKHLVNHQTKLYIHFAVHVADILENFMIPFQTSNPVIHCIFPAFTDLFFNLMSLFVKKEFLLTSHSKHRKNAYELGKFKLSENNLKSLHDMDFGTKNRHMFAQLEQKSNIDIVKIQFKLAYLELVSYLQSKLPHDSIILKDLEYIDPKKKSHSSSLNAIARTAYTFSSVLKNTNFTSLSPDKYTDLIKTQYKHFQSESIDIQKSKIDDFWVAVGALEDHHKFKKFNELSHLMLAALSLSHGNVIPERGFSLNKYVLQNRESLKENTIEAIRITKDYLVHFENITDFPITKKLLTVSYIFLI